MHDFCAYALFIHQAPRLWLGNSRTLTLLFGFGLALFCQKTTNLLHLFHIFTRKTNKKSIQIQNIKSRTCRNAKQSFKKLLKGQKTRWRHSCVALALCVSSSSCRKTNLWFQFARRFLSDDIIFSSRIPQYFAAFILPSTLKSHPVSVAKKHCHSIKPPLPCMVKQYNIVLSGYFKKESSVFFTFRL